MCCWFKGKVASCLLLRCVESLQQVLLKPNLYTCREADVPRPPQAINLNWVSEKRILRVQVRRLTLCYCNLIFFWKLWLVTRHSLLPALSSLSQLHSFFSQDACLFIPTLWHEGTPGRTISLTITVGCLLFNHDFSYFSQDYLGFFLGCCWVPRAIIAGKRVKWQCIKIFLIKTEMKDNPHSFISKRG